MSLNFIYLPACLFLVVVISYVLGFLTRYVVVKYRNASLDHLLQHITDHWRMGDLLHLTRQDGYFPDGSPKRWGQSRFFGGVVVVDEVTETKVYMKLASIHTPEDYEWVDVSTIVVSKLKNISLLERIQVKNNLCLNHTCCIT